MAKGKHGMREEKENVLQMLRNIAQSETEEEYKKRLAVLNQVKHGYRNERNL